jgi:hypothetical protein
MEMDAAEIPFIAQAKICAVGKGRRRRGHCFTRGKRKRD